MKRNILNGEGGGKLREVTETLFTGTCGSVPSGTLEEVVFTGGSNFFIKK